MSLVLVVLNAKSNMEVYAHSSNMAPIRLK